MSKREVTRVEFKRRKDLVIYVGTLSAVQALECNSRVRQLEATTDILAEQIAAFACDENGAPLFADRAAALAFMAEPSTSIGIVKSITKAGNVINALDDEAIEGELKN